MVWSKTFKSIEKPLGFELYDWQKAYISMESNYIPSYRQCGATTAFILRHLLNYGEKISKSRLRIIDAAGVDYWSIFPRDGHFSVFYERDIYPKMVLDIDYKLRSVGVDTWFK